MRFILLLLLSGCLSKVQKHKHTFKLQPSTDIQFLSKTDVIITCQEATPQLRVILDHDGNKTEITNKKVTCNQKFHLDFDLPDTGLLAAIVTWKTKQGQNMSRSATYVIGEQEEINRIRKSK